MIHRVFVYGTLRQSQKSTHILKGYRLWDLGPFPCITKEPGTVHGNIIRVDDARLAELDRIEGVRRGFYNRVEVVAEGLINGKKTGCFVYVAGNVLDHDVHPVPIESGDWHKHPSKQKFTFQPYA